jgi:hypothetical protein
MAREQTQLFHQNVKAEMEEMLAIELPHVENIGFTTEEWQSKSGKTSLLLSIHYVNQRFQLWKFAVACRSTEGFTENNRSVLLQLMINDVPGLRNQDHCSGTVDWRYPHEQENIGHRSNPSPGTNCKRLSVIVDSEQAKQAIISQ